MHHFPQILLMVLILFGKIESLPNLYYITSIFEKWEVTYFFKKLTFQYAELIKF